MSFLNHIHLTLDYLVSVINNELNTIVPNASKILIANTTGFKGYVIDSNSVYN